MSRSNALASLLTASPLWGHRNKIINGNFDIWQRGTSFSAAATALRYGADRWAAQAVGSAISQSRQSFTIGQTDVPGEPKYFHRCVVASSPGAGNYALLQQRIESVRTLAGKMATLSFWAKADAEREMAVEFIHYFGTGGSPSETLYGIAVKKVLLTTSWQPFWVTAELPSIAGKTLGTNGDDFLNVVFRFDAGSNYNDRTDSLGQQSGTFDIARVSLVEGDATNFPDPFEARHPQQELALCQRYYERLTQPVLYPFTNAGDASVSWFFKVEKRAVPTVGGAGSNYSTVTPAVDHARFYSAAANAPSVTAGAYADAEL